MQHSETLIDLESIVLRKRNSLNEFRMTWKDWILIRANRLYRYVQSWIEFPSQAELWWRGPNLEKTPEPRSNKFHRLNVGQWQSRINWNFLKNVEQCKLNENKRSFWIYESRDIGKNINIYTAMLDQYCRNFEFLWWSRDNDSKTEYDFRVGLQNWSYLSFEGNFGL